MRRLHHYYKAYQVPRVPFSCGGGKIFSGREYSCVGGRRRWRPVSIRAAVFPRAMIAFSPLNFHTQPGFNRIARSRFFFLTIALPPHTRPQFTSACHRTVDLIDSRLARVIRIAETHNAPNMKVFSNECTFDYSWEEVSTANWRKYCPWNEKSTHVIAVDIVSRQVDPATGIVCLHPLTFFSIAILTPYQLRTERLITCKQSAP